MPSRSMAYLALPEVDFAPEGAMHSEPVDVMSTFSALSEFDDAKARGPHEDAGWRCDRLQRLVETVWRSMFSEACPHIVQFSPREYSSATKNSDWYYSLEIEEHLSARGGVFRTKLRQHMCQCGLAVWSQTEDQLKLNTLKWKFKDDAIQNFLNVSSSASMALARATFSYLQPYYAQDSTMPESAKRVESLLRGAEPAMVQSVPIFEWSEQIIRRVKHLARKINNFDEIVQYLQHVKTQFLLYGSEVNGRVDIRYQQCQLPWTEQLRVTRNNLIELVCEAGSFFNVSRFKVRKYLRCCVSAAVHQNVEDLAFGIFTPGAIADILEALVGHKYFNDKTSLALLRKSLPSALVKLLHERPTKTPCNNKTQRKRKVIKESVQKSRQVVQWNMYVQLYGVSWITKKELLAQYGEWKAEKMWREECFKGTRKIFTEFEQPVTEADAVASWMNMGWSWDDARTKWRDASQVELPPNVVDDNSRACIRRKLQETIL